MIHLLALLLYAAAFVVWIRVLLRGSAVQRPRAASVVAAFAVLVHAGALIAFGVQFGELPLRGLGPALSSLAFVGGLVLLATLPMREGGRVGIVVLPFILVCLGTGLAVGIRPAAFPLDFEGAAFVLHVSMALLGYQGFALAFAAGILYLIQHHELKEKRLGRFFRFIPPLVTLDLLGRVGLWIGFGALTLALALGWEWTVRHRGTLQLADPKVIWAAASWVVLLSVILARRGSGPTELRGAVAAVVGFALVLVGFVAVRVVAGGDGLFL